MPADPLVLTLRLDPATFAVFDRLRHDHFPPGRTAVPAHVTLFHALPGGEADDIRRALAEATSGTPPVPVRVPAVRFLGRGVAVDVEGAGLVRVRKRLAAAFDRWLTPQDRQPYRPHVTVQNKADPAAARLLYDWLASGWAPFDGVGEALELWHYRGGPWEPAGAFPFAGG